MNAPSPPEASSSAGARLRATLDGLSFGVQIYGADRRVVWINRAFADLASLPPEVVQPGRSFAEVTAAMHAHGWYGSGPAADAQAEAALDIDFSRAQHLTRHTADGRVLDVRYAPLPDGGFVVTTTNVSALAAAEAEARTRAAQRDTVLAASRAGIAVYGPDHRLVLHNAAYAALVGFGPGEPRAGMQVREVMQLLQARGEFASDAGGAYVDHVVAIDRTRPHTRRRTRPNGLVLDFASDPLPDGGFVLTVADVTLLARAEAEAMRRAAVLETVLAALPQGISVFGPDRRAVLLNPAYRSIMGDAAVAPGEHMEALIARRRAAGEYGEAEAAARYAAEAGRDAYVAARRRRARPDGTVIDVRTAPLPDGGHISVVSDVTLEIAAQAEVQRRTALLDLMLRHVRHGLMLFDADDRVVTFNPQAESLTGIERGWLRPGVSRAEIIDHLTTRGVYGTDEAGAAMAQRLRSGDPRLVPRIERSLPDGRVVEQQSDPTPDGGYVLAIHDVTWRREAEAALRDAKETAEAASRAKSRFLATMSHELRTPLNAVIGFSEAIAHEATGTGGRIGEFAAAVNEAGRHLLALINDILDVARIEAGRVELDEATIDLGDLLAFCRRMMDPAARAAGVQLHAALPAALPLLRGDARRLRQVVLNLLSNAVKFTPSGGTVRLAAGRSADGGLDITVSDSGIGIAADDVERAFEPFTQLVSEAAPRGQGSGLGLFTARALAAAHGGTLTLASDLGRGTTARLALPAVRLLAPGATLPIS